MNNQLVKASWRLIEDFPPEDKSYVVAFLNSEGSFDPDFIDVWEFSSGQWISLFDSRFQDSGLPSYYIDLPLPTN